MREPIKEIEQMLDVLDLPLVSARLTELLRSPQLSDYSALQLLREILQTQYIETKNNRFQRNLRLSSLINRGAEVGNLKTGNGRIYNDNTVQQVLTFQFVESRQNVGVYGVTDVGNYVSCRVM